MWGYVKSVPGGFFEGTVQFSCLGRNSRDRISFCSAHLQPRAILISSHYSSGSSPVLCPSWQIFLLPLFILPTMPELYFTFSFPLTSRPLQSFLAPSLLIWLLLMSRWTSTLLTLRASPRATAPSLPMPFQERLSIFSAPLPSRERREILATAHPSSAPPYPFLPGWERSIPQVIPRQPQWIQHLCNVTRVSPTM